jgi:hypothetical protein
VLRITQGDQVTFNLTARSGAGALVDLTSATFSTQISGPNQTVVVFPNSQHTANPDQVNYKGQFTLALSSTDTSNLAWGSGLEVLTLILVNGTTPVYFHGPSILTVLQNIPAMQR